MQFLKEELRVKILESATNEFHDKGYNKASMRTIAKHSRITVGNIYRYFDGKEALFEAVVNEAYERFYDVVSTNVADSIIQSNDGNLYAEMRVKLIESLVTCVKEKRVELLILLRGAEGTKYENMREDFQQLIYKKVVLRFEPVFQGDRKNAQISFIAEVISKSCVEGLVEAIIQYDDEKELKEVMEMIYNYYFLNLEIRFSHLTD